LPIEVGGREEPIVSVIPLLVLAGHCLLLWTPLLGHFSAHQLQHLLVHYLHDREKKLAVGLSLGLWAFPLLMLLCLCFRLWWEAGDLGIVLLVQIKVFGPLAEH
jgi:hypothetical protein